MPQISAEQAIRGSLRQAGTPAAKAALANADVVKSMAAQLEATLGLVKEGVPLGVSVTLGLAKKGLENSKLVQKATDSKALKIGNFFADEMLQTLSLLKLAADASPGKVAATVGTMFLKKTSAAFNFGATSKDQKCIGAWLDVAGSAAGLGLADPYRQRKA
ncbi:MAG: hypothetical protein CFE45_17510 [Burkholderiales bacterium PBB5]|nr:MAG: hypothetical protein CFE45_17510 [Burkholderiales bacterium PBB5]